MAEANAPLGIAATRLKLSGEIIVAAFKETKRKQDHTPHFTKLFIPAADLSYSNLSGCWFEDCDLSDVNLTQANLSFVRFCNCSLQSTNLDSANLYDSHFLESDLSNADLGYANLDRARFTRVNLEEVNVCEAKITDDTWLAGTDWWKVRTQNYSSLEQYEQQLLLALYKCAHGTLPDADTRLTKAMQQFIEPLRKEALATAKREPKAYQSDEVEVIEVQPLHCQEGD